MQQTIQTIPFLSLGQTVITSNAQETLDFEDVHVALRQHEALDWGEVCDEDRRTNNNALKHGLRIISNYRDRNDTKFWIITEADRSVTTILLPEDY